MSNKSSGPWVQYWYHRLEERCIYLLILKVYSLKITELCRKRGYTKYKVSSAYRNAADAALGNMLNQKSMPTMANLEKICDAFEITIAQFFSDDEQIGSDKRAKKYLRFGMAWMRRKEIL